MFLAFSAKGKHDTYYLLIDTVNKQYANFPKDLLNGNIKYISVSYKTLKSMQHDLDFENYKRIWSL